MSSLLPILLAVSLHGPLLDQMVSSRRFHKGVPTSSVCFIPMAPVIILKANSSTSHLPLQSTPSGHCWSLSFSISSELPHRIWLVALSFCPPDSRISSPHSFTSTSTSPTSNTSSSRSMLMHAKSVSCQTKGRSSSSSPSLAPSWTLAAQCPPSSIIAVVSNATVIPSNFKATTQVPSLVKGITPQSNNP